MRIISGEFRGRQIQTPKGGAIRPTTSQARQSLFNICQGYIAGAHFLDLCAGSGAMGLEALSRGAASATFVENERQALRCIHDNIALLKVSDRSRIYSGSVFEVLPELEKQSKRFDVIYCDFPYGVTCLHEGRDVLALTRALEILDASSMLAEGGEVFIEGAASEEDEPLLVHLVLKSSRRLAAARLRQYTPRS